MWSSSYNYTNHQYKPDSSFTSFSLDSNHPSSSIIINSSYLINGINIDKNNKQNEQSVVELIKEEYGSKGVNLCGIINYGNNCYLNSGLQILVSCENFISELNKTKSKVTPPLLRLTKDAMDKLSTKEVYDPKDFLLMFSRKNEEFCGVQSCSQNFIRTLLKNLNDELIKNI